MFKKTFRYSFKKGLPREIFISPSFILRYKKKDLQDSKYGVVVSKKVDKRAVVRNSIKRRFLNVLKDVFLEKESLYDLVFFLKKVSLSKNKEDLDQEIKTALSKLKIL